MKARALLLGAVASAAMAGSASAGGWYVAGDVGLNGLADIDVGGTFLGAPTTGTISNDLGWAVTATVGADVSRSWRVEGELGFRQNDTTSGLAEVTDWSLMLNVLYDIELSQAFDLSIGGGLGASHSKFNVSAFTSDTDTNIAFQLMAGLSYAIGPATDLTLAYRYMYVADPTYQFGQAATFEFDSLSNRTLSVGLRWHLSPTSDE